MEMLPGLALPLSREEKDNKKIPPFFLITYLHFYEFGALAYTNHCGWEETLNI